MKSTVTMYFIDTLLINKRISKPSAKKLFVLPRKRKTVP